jgi:hypothetical protein
MRIHRVVFLSFVLLVALVPGTALAQDRGDEGLLVRIGGSITVTPEETIEVLIAIDSDVVMDGTVRGALILLGADTIINGTVDGDVVAVGGTLVLSSTALITGDVSYNNVAYERDQGAVVQGTQRSDFGANFGRDFSRWAAWLSLATWAGTTVLMLAAGIVFAGIGGRQLWASSANITRNPLQSILSILALGLIAVILITLLFISILGIPIAFAMMLIVGAVWALGHIAAGTRIGAALTRRRIEDSTIAHPYLPTIVGIMVLQIFALIPVFIGLVLAYSTQGSLANAIGAGISWLISAMIGIVGLFGAGALIYYAWLAWTNRGTARTANAGTGRP